MPTTTKTHCAKKPVHLTQWADMIREKSTDVWGDKRAVVIAGESSALSAILRKTVKFAAFDEPILITGESGVGKELFASACHVLSERANKPFICVNCAHYTETNLSISELFGHKKGSFTGAFADHVGLFEEADHGTIFLDEIADLPIKTQVMLLRTLALGEFHRLGENKARRVDVRVIAATNRPLKELIAANEFRNDLYFRLSYFRLEIPPLRGRERDWRQLIEFYLCQLINRYKIERRFSDASLRVLADYTWPGNIRELRSVVTTGYSMADSEWIEPNDFASALYHDDAAPEVTVTDGSEALANALLERNGNFWDLVYMPFMNRDLNRRQVTGVVSKLMDRAGGSYSSLVRLINMPRSEYRRFVDFLRHHDLHPSANNSENWNSEP